MGTIADKLAYTMDSKNSIKAAIMDKGVDVPDSTPLGEYGEKVLEISGGGSGTPPIVTGLACEYKQLVLSVDTVLRQGLTASHFDVQMDDEVVQPESITEYGKLQVGINLVEPPSEVTVKVRAKGSAFRYSHGATEYKELDVSLLNPLLDNITGMTLVSWTSDDGSQSFDIPAGSWSFNGADVAKLWISGNSWIGVGSESENVKVNRRDTYIQRYYKGAFELTGGLKVYKVRWEGWSPYNSRVDANKYVWEVFFLSNGDAMVYLASVGANTTWDGVNNFCGAAYTLNMNNRMVSFYRNDAAGADWTVVNGPYARSAY